MNLIKLILILCFTASLAYCQNDSFAEDGKKTINEISSFTKKYLTNTTVGIATGVAAGYTCALLTQPFIVKKYEIDDCIWIGIIWLITSSIRNHIAQGLEQSLKEHSLLIPGMVHNYARLADWVSYVTTLYWLIKK